MQKILVGIFGNCQPCLSISNLLNWKQLLYCCMFSIFLLQYEDIFHLRLLWLDLSKIPELSPLPVWVQEGKREDS